MSVRLATTNIRLKHEGAGTLILIGGTSDRWRTTEHIDSAAVELAPKGRPVAFIPAAACPQDYGLTFLETYRSLGSEDGYVVPVHDRSSAMDRANAELIASAGLVYFGGGETTALLEAMTDTPVLDAVRSAYESGAVIAGMSAGAIALSAWGVPLNPDIGVLRGWGWLERTVVSVHHTPQRDGLLERALKERTGFTGLALPEDVAIVFPPEGEPRALGALGPSILR
jgi:cyanophycinase